MIAICQSVYLVKFWNLTTVLECPLGTQGGCPTNKPAGVMQFEVHLGYQLELDSLTRPGKGEMTWGACAQKYVQVQQVTDLQSHLWLFWQPKLKTLFHFLKRTKLHTETDLHQRVAKTFQCQQIIFEPEDDDKMKIKLTC